MVHLCRSAQKPRPPTSRQTKLHLELQPSRDDLDSNSLDRMLNVHVLDAIQLGTTLVTVGVVEARSHRAHSYYRWFNTQHLTHLDCAHLFALLLDLVPQTPEHYLTNENNFATIRTKNPH